MKNLVVSRYLVLMFTILCLSTSISAQNKATVYNFRGKGFDMAVKTARANSQKNAIFLVIASNDQEFTGFFTRLVNFHITAGMERIYVILSDRHYSRSQNECYLIANGEKVGTWFQKDEIKKNAEYYFESAEILEKIKTTYKKYIL